MALLLVFLVPLGALVIYAVVYDLRACLRTGLLPVRTNLDLLGRSAVCR